MTCLSEGGAERTVRAALVEPVPKQNDSDDKPEHDYRADSEQNPCLAARSDNANLSRMPPRRLAELDQS